MVQVEVLVVAMMVVATVKDGCGAVVISGIAWVWGICGQLFG